MSFDLNNGIPRRDFIKQAGRAAAFGLIGEGLYGASGTVALIVDSSDPAASSPQAKWAASELRQAVTAKGATLELVNSPEAAASDALKIVVAGTGSPMARGFLEAGAAAPVREAFLMMPGKMSGKASMLVSVPLRKSAWTFVEGSWERFDYRLGGDAEEFGDEGGLRDGISFGYPPHSALPDHLHCLDALQRPPCRSERTVAFRQPSPLLHRAMILFHYIVEVFALT